MECRHPAIVAGKCLDCGALVEAEKAAKQAPVQQDGGTAAAAEAATAAEKQPAAAKETAKKAAQKQK